MPELIDLQAILYSGGQAKSLVADKMRHHILQCLGIYFSKFGSLNNFSLPNNPADLSKIEAAKSNIFLSTIRDVAAFALVENVPDAASDGRTEAFNRLFRDGFLTGAKKLQVESDEEDWLPLHWAGLTDGISSDDVRATLGHSTTNCKGSKASALHYAAISPNPNFLAMKEMSSPYSFLRKDSNDELPIHWAATTSKDVEVLRYLVEKCPSSLRKRNRSNKTPLQRLISRDPFDAQFAMVSYLAEYEAKHLVTTDQNRSTVLHTFCRLNIICEKMVAIFHKILHCFPDAVRTRDSEGALPLHHAVSTDGCWASGIVQELLAVYKEGATIADRDGRLSVHCLFDEESATEERLKILLEANPAGILPKTVEKKTVMHCAAFSECCSRDSTIVEMLHKLNPTAAQLKDRDGNLPLHLACRMAFIEVMKAVYACYPAAISTENDLGSVPLDCYIDDMMEDTSCWDQRAHGDTLQLLLRHSPHSAVHKYALQSGPPPPEGEEDSGNNLPDFVRRLFLRADPTAHPNELRALNYAERRMAMFLIFSALSGDSPRESFVNRLRSLAFDYGPDMCLIKAIVSFL
jgi:ankyrin repeat protein